MARFEGDAVSMFKADKPYIRFDTPKFASGEEIEGLSDEGEFVRGRITALGEISYRIESSKRSYTIRMNQAKYPPPEEKISEPQPKKE